MSNKRGRHARKGGRTTPKGTRPLELVHSRHQASPREPGLMDMVAEALREAHPLDLIGLVSSMVWLASPSAPGRPSDLPTIDALVDMWADVESRETTALLRAVASLGQRPELRMAATSAADQRSHRLPTWLEGLAKATVTRIVEVGHVLGDGEALILDVAVPGSAPVILDVYVDHNLGTYVKDAFVATDSVDSVLNQMTTLLDEPGTSVTDLSLADGRAKLAEALANPLSSGFFQDDNSSWPRSRPVVEWIVRSLPPGGTGYVRRRWNAEQLDELVDRFFASPWGRALRNRSRRRLLELLVRHVSEDDDPMRWSPARIQVLDTDAFIGEDDLVPDDVELLPDLLRAFVGYCHGERGIPEPLTDDTMAAVDHWALLLQRTIDEHTELIGDEADYASPMWSWGSEILAELVAATGSVDALRNLSVERLPDEPFDWSAVPHGAVEAVEPVVALVDEVCDHFFDAELRTAARRLIARLASADPSLFTRRSRLENTAATLVWTVATANDAFTTHDVLVKDLGSHLGVHSSPSQRADTLLRTLPGGRRSFQGVALGTTDFLTSTGRSSIIAQRDRGLRLLAGDLLEPEAWPRIALDDIPIEDPDALWAIVEMRSRFPA